MTKFEIAVNGGKADAEFHVHAAGCADVAKGVRSGKYSHSYTSAGDSAQDVVADEVAEFKACEQDWFEDDFRILPCAKVIR